MDESWVKYQRWSAAISHEFFSGEHSGLPVYLDLESEIFARVGAKVDCARGSELQALDDAVIATLRFPPERGRFFTRHRGAVRLWQLRGRQDPPPCVGILAFFSSVAEEMSGSEDYRANNYYGRLARRLHVHDSQVAKMIGDFQYETPQLWAALNQWLEDSEGRFGLATAWAFDFRRFVGVPISQALVREADRQQLAGLFSYFGLQPGQRLSALDMTHLIEEWIGTASPTLRRLWGHREVRERVAAIACQELESWSGRDRTSHGTPVQDARMALVALVRFQPLPRLDLRLFVRRNGGDEAPCGLDVVSGSSVQAAAAFPRNSQGFGLCPTAYEAWWSFDQVEQISIADVLIATVRLEPRTGDRRLVSRQMRRVVPLKFDEADRIYTEVLRVELGEKHLVIAHESIFPEVLRTLAEISVPGYRTFNAASLPGLPQGWCAASDVIIVRQFDGEADMAALSAVASVQLSVVEGLVLPFRSMWHSHKQPGIRVVGPDEDGYQVALASAYSGLEAKTVLGPARGAAYYPLRDHGLADDDYRVFLEESDGGKAPIAHATLRLRSASFSSPTALTGSEWFGHQLPKASEATGSDDGALWALSASSAADADAIRGIRGALVEDGLEDRDAWRVPALDVRLPIAPGEGVREEEPYEGPATPRARSEVPHCILEGVHVWLCPPAGPGLHPAREGYCRQCGLGKRFPKVRSQVARTNVAVSVLPTRTVEPQPQPPAPPPSGDASEPDFDLLLDAASYIGGGAWPAFMRLASQVSESKWFPLESAQILSALGHIDIKWDEGRPVQWSIAPSTIVTVDGAETAFMAGRRSNRLLERIRGDTGALGGEFTIAQARMAPACITLKGLRHADLCDVAKSCGSYLGEKVIVSSLAGNRLASLLPTLLSVARVLPRRHSPVSGLFARYDPGTGAWVPCRQLDAPGGYRIQGEPVVYAIVLPEDGTSFCRPVDSRTTKHMAAAMSGTSLFGFDNGVLRVPLGARLPGLYERAVVLCSGSAPCDSRGHSIYTAVPESFAKLLFSRLYLL